MVVAESLLLKAAAGLATAAYIDAKLGLGNDAHLGKAAATAGLNYRLRVWRGKLSIYEFFDQAVSRSPEGIAYVFEGRSWTWRQADQDVRRIANFLIGKGLKPNDRVAIFMGNSVAYPLLWLACMAAGIVPAFINNGLSNQGLVHCIKVSKARVVIYEPALEATLLEVLESLEKNTVVREFVLYNDGLSDDQSEKAIVPKVPGAVYFGPAEVAAQSNAAISPKLREHVEGSSTACLIFTSGTTGLPKAALCSHGRIGSAMCIWPALNSFTPKDRIYTPMPLYHSSAAFLCIGAAWRAGSTVIIGRKFSASKYWQEVRANDATVVQYIGEIARYLLAVPPHPDDKNHRVRMAYGNGMRPDVWERFRERYGVRVISEFYASSEGNGALMNYNTGPFGAGAVGRFAAIASKARPDFKIVQVDPITEDIYRNPKTGLCVECAPGESGEFLMRINMENPISAFQGYADNPEATKKKILGDVFVKGDLFFRSGDLMKVDEDGFFYFGDRMGDTFRWRSENVSTAEVSAALGEVVSEANVYGVLVPGHDGRAGCAALPINDIATLDFKHLAKHARKTLPKYAVPIFLRIVPAMEQTGTVKQLKVALRNQGIEHAKVGPDPLYWLPPGAESYRPFLPSDYQAVAGGKVKL